MPPGWLDFLSRGSMKRYTRMLTKALLVRNFLLAVILCSASLFGQQPSAPGSSGVIEFPITLRQNIDAGKTVVGTKIQANLVTATLVNGTVIPRDAILSGEVTESVAKTKTDPSRLAIRMDSAQWKNGSAALKIYLTAWYYPEAMLANQNVSYESSDAAKSNKNWNGMGAYPNPNTSISQDRFPGRDADQNTGAATPDSTASSISKHRVSMKNVDSLRSDDGVVTLTSKRSTIKLDKLTTYVLATSGTVPNR
jgi:hypothetical protein